jgi:hypothetical protein
MPSSESIYPFLLIFIPFDGPRKGLQNSVKIGENEYVAFGVIKSIFF